MSLVLIVEDNEKNLKLVRDVLQVKGYETIEAIAALRANAATAHIPVIAVTASVMQQDRKLIMEAGFDAYLGKPLDLKEFLATVKRVLEAPRR